jgi:hypothetical protein
VDNILAALERRDRVREITVKGIRSFGFGNGFGRIATAISRPYTTDPQAAF